ncbi:MAG: class I SAM-dependent methyltransferase [Parvularculaceae bacterium]
MIEGKPSRTAMSVAYLRALHRERDDPPWVLDDPFARLFVREFWDRVVAQSDVLYTPAMQAAARAFIAARQRYVEERLEAGAFAQYVILGAGYDSFVWRRPDLVRRFRVFEVDHPASQAFKRARAGAIGLPRCEDVSYVAIDFEKETLISALERSGFDWTAPTFFGWLGVTMYLTTEATEATLRTVAACAKGSEIGFSWCPDPAGLSAFDRETRAVFAKMAASFGEPADTTYTEETLKALVARGDLRLLDLPAPADIGRRYFADRKDGLSPYGLERVAVAGV